MTSTNHSSFPPFTIDLNEDRRHHYHLLFSSKSTTEVASSSSSISYPLFLNPSHEEVGYYRTELQPFHHQEGNLYGGSWDDHHTPKHVKENKNSQILSFPNKEDKSKSTVINNEDHQSHENGSMKWISSKARLMKKMMPSDHPTETSIHKFGDVKARSSPLQDDNNTKNLSTSTIRVCADCNTTKTPLWRSGPRGPKSLCNACGIRQRKARRALAAAQASASGTTFPTDKSGKKTAKKVQNKEKKTNNNSHLPFKKRCKFTAQSRGIYRKKQLCFEDLSSVILSKNSTLQHLFPRDEKEAAVLLMALSYGMVHG